MGFGLAVHLLVLWWVRRNNYLKWPSGILIGGIVSVFLYLSHPAFWLVLVFFFGSSSFLSHFREAEKRKSTESYSKGGTRDGWQVLANSLGLVIFGLANLWVHGSVKVLDPVFFLPALTFAASATADTWATEVGTLSSSTPRSILNFRKTIPKGASGGVTIIGTVAAYCGSLLLSTTGVVFLIGTGSISSNISTILLVAVLSLVGFLGQVVDSLLGSIVQVRYYCPICEGMVEMTQHIRCGTENLNRSQGVPHFNNDVVNLVSNLVASTLSLAVIVPLIL